MSPSFTPSEKTRLKRRPQRGSYDEATIFAILDAGVIGHVGYVIDGEPYVTPTAYWREGRRLYWHGAAASRMLRHQAEGLPVCVTVSHLDGFVLSRTGFTHSLLYRSVMAFGRTSPITDRETKRRAMEAFIDRLCPGRARTLRPMQAAELDAIALMSMVIEEASAKIRDGGVMEKNDEDYAVRVWAGVIPIHAAIGKAMPDSRLAPDLAAPGGLAVYGENARLDAVLSVLAQPG
jgi:uncharacterized protein